MIIFDDEAVDDLERIFAFNTLSFDAAWALEQLELIRSAVGVLDLHPHIGRPVQGERELRELIISVGKTGFVALYQYDELDGVVRVLAVRHQREAGYRAR